MPSPRLLAPLARAAFVAALAAVPLTAVLVPSDASASVSIAVTFDQLCLGADSVAAVTSSESTSAWEGNRIYTYTKVHVDQGVAGELAAGQDAYVRTMGGVVGNIGQMVDGEAVLSKDYQSLLFLRKFKPGVYEVTARGQGQYPIQIDPKTKARSFIKSTAAGVLLPPRQPTPDQASSASGVQTQSREPTEGATAESAQVIARLATDVLHQRAFDDGAREIASTWKRVHTPAPQTK